MKRMRNTNMSEMSISEKESAGDEVLAAMLTS
jgi:hypothetical protein